MICPMVKRVLRVLGVRVTSVLRLSGVTSSARRGTKSTRSCIAITNRGTMSTKAGTSGTMSCTVSTTRGTWGIEGY